MRPQARLQQRHQQQQQQHQQSNGYHNPQQYQNPGMMNNPQMMMNNPMMGHMNNMQNMPIHPQFFNNMPQQQFHPFGLPNPLLPNLLGSLQFAAAAANTNLMGGHSFPLVQPNFFPPSQPPRNSFNPRPYPPVPPPPQNNHQLRPPGFSEPRPQVQPVGNINNTNGSNSTGNDFRNKFTKHQKFRGSGQGFHRSLSHQANNAKKRFNKDHKGKGNYNKMAAGLDGSNAGSIEKEKKRPYVLTYTPKEIQQWRQARRKNFPTKLNAEKKLKKNDSSCSLDDEAKMRRQQLREVLAKQAELGVEVAEVPSHYLSNPIEQVNGDNSGKFQNKDGKKGRFSHNKRGHGGKDKFNKRRKFQDKDPSQESSTTTREPTLLEKLLSADIKRDKIQLLQVFRFMVMNSFFKESPEQPLKLPLVMVEETGCEHVEEDLSDDNDDDVDGDDNSCDENSD